MKGILILIFTLLSIADTALSQAQESLQILFSKSIKAYEAKDYPEFLKLTGKANQLRPYHPTITYNLAAAYSLNGKLDSAEYWLQEVIKMNASVDFESDKDFSRLITEPSRIETLRSLKGSVEHKVERSTLYESLESKTHIESIAFHPPTGLLFLGSVNERSIYYGNSEKGLNLWVSHQDLPKMYSVMGLDFDESDNSLWVCTAALSEMERYDESLKGSSSVFQLDAETGTVITQAEVQEENTFGDLFMLNKGEVLISDATRNIIYSLKSGEKEFTIFADLSDRIFNLQGLAINREEGFLFLSDYLNGLYRMDMKTKELLPIELPASISKKGFDGIYLSGNRLMLTQNGTRPMRVVDLIFNDDFTSISDWNIIDQNMEYLNEPTQGFVHGNDFHFVSNSQWGNYSDGIFNKEEAEAVVIRKYTFKR